MRRSLLFLLPLLALAAAPLAAPLAAQEPVERIEIRGERLPARGWLGIQFQSREEGEADGPVYVAEVFPGSPAERAGVQRGDTLLRLDGKAARPGLVRALRLSPGDTVRLQLRRAGRTRDMTVVAQERAPNAVVIRTGGRERTVDVDSIRDLVAVRIDTLTTYLDSVFVRMDSLRQHVRRARPGRALVLEMDSLIERGLPDLPPFSIEIGSRALAGAEFTQLDPGLGRYFRTEKGLLALRVAPGSPAARAGLEAGDVVLKADGREVETLRALRREVSRARRERLRLEVLREGKRREIELKWDR